ncbi:MAG: ATP-dependent DNA ligase [Gammaproteobacteria bacterium]
MRDFSRLYEALDATTSTNRKVQAMVDYFSTAPAADAAGAAWVLSGRRLKRLVGPAELRRWLCAESGLPAWLVEESYAAVGDLAETVGLLAAGRSDPGGADTELGLARWVEERLLGLRGLEAGEREEAVRRWWRALTPEAAFLLTKLLTGALRVGVSQTLVARALAEHAGLPRPVIVHRLMGDWTPSESFWRGLLDPETRSEDEARPYPFFLASPLETGEAGEPASLGDRQDWQAEWKWDGIRAQLVRRNEVYLWSRGEELITGVFPEVAERAAELPPGVVLDGELLAWKEGVLPFASLQRRLGRKRVSARLREEVPVLFLAYDLLELDGRDQRDLPLAERRRHLEALAGKFPAAIGLSPVLDADDWSALARSRAESRPRGVEGLMLKRLESAYGVGRRRGSWWKWKVDPWTVDAVMLYAQAGHGRRASLYTDYTFAVRHGDELVPVAKAYSGLEDREITELDRWIRRNTVERFGPVRAVRPEQVFELAFEGIAPSSRHKSGVALRFPRIARWRRDLGPADADTLDDVRKILEGSGG